MARGRPKTGETKDWDRGEKVTVVDDFGYAVPGQR